MSNADTIAAIATAPGAAGVAVVRVSGEDAYEVAQRVAGRPIKKGLSFIKMALDECVVLGFRAPHSYTGEDVVEFQCHGGVVTPRRILEALFAAGARLARRGEFTERAFLHGKLDFEQAESVLNLIEAKTERAADRALEGLRGKGKRACEELYRATLELSVRLEHALDISEEELSDAFLAKVKSDLARLKDELGAALKRVREGKLLREGALVVLAGPPNAGKSSLMNALLEENRAIVSNQPGTTRDAIEEWMELGGFPIRLVDTAGLRMTSDQIEAEGVKRARGFIERATIVVRLSENDQWAEAGPNDLRVRTKIDLVRPVSRMEDVIGISVRTGEGIATLKEALLKRLERIGEAGGGADDVYAAERGIAGLSEALRVIKEIPDEDLVLAANGLRRAAETLGELIGATYSEDLLTSLFSRFCVGK